ncbi:hypothetical protein ACFLYF_02700 [Chloroflexota bacterium]
MKRKDSSGWFLSVGFLAIVGLLVCMFLSANVFFRIGAVLLGLLLLILVYLFSRKLDEEDRVEGIPTNKVSMIHTAMPILYGLAGLGIIGRQFQDGSMSDFSFWLGIEFGVFLLYIAWKHNRTGEAVARALEELRELRKIVKEMEENDKHQADSR